MPSLWSETVDEHRRAVRDAILDATAALVAEHGLRGVTMSQVASGAGIGRATLYKYFSDVEAVLSAWHERRVAEHLDHLAALRDGEDDPWRRVEAVLNGWVQVAPAAGDDQHRHGEAWAPLHRESAVVEGHRRLHSLVSDILEDAARAGQVRGDVPPGELAGYCLHALGAAGELRSEAAVRRLVALTLDAVRA